MLRLISNKGGQSQDPPQLPSTQTLNGRQDLLVETIRAD